MQIQVTVHMSVLLLVTSFDYQGLNKSWSSSIFLPYSGSWQSSVIKKKKKGAKRTLKGCQWFCLPPAVCEVLKDPCDESVYKKKQTLLLCSVTQIKRDVGGNQVICVQGI